MDYSLLDKHLEEMEPYFKKWFREYNIMMLNSSLESVNYEVSIDISLDPKDAICQDYMYSIYNAFHELVKSYCYSMSAYLIEKELREKGEISWSNYWKYEIKNYYFRSIIPRYFSILDYIAVMINEISRQQLISNIRDVTFERIKKKLLKAEDKDIVGWLTRNDIEQINKIFAYVYANITDKEKEILKPYRDKVTHRYLVGIDELTVSVHRRKLTEEEIKLFDTKDNYVYSFKGKPEFEFVELNAIIEKLIVNLDSVMCKLLKLDMMKDFLVVKDS